MYYYIVIIGAFSGPTFRPHVEHVAWLAQLAQNEGHTVIGLSCDGAVTDCYARALLGRGRIGCVGCSLAGLRAFSDIKTQSARGVRPSASLEGWHDSEILSSVRTLLREEDDARLVDPPTQKLINRLAPTAAKMFGIISGWIEREGLDALLVFNGRMDITRAAIRAAQAQRIRFASVERSSFDTGILITPITDCNSPKSEERLQLHYRDVPLLRDQVLRSAEFIARRAINLPVSEWRTYNKDRISAPWPEPSTGTRVLVGPSSQYEVVGGEGWENIGDMRGAVEAVIAKLGPNVSVVVRGHPVWSETIASMTGESTTCYYRDWCRKHKYHFIEPESNIDTRSLIKQADLVLATGGTIGVEAACAGCAVLALAPCYYRHGGGVGNAVGNDAIETALAIRNVPVEERVRRTLRSIYTHAFRTTQFCDFARPVQGTSGATWEYRDGADFRQVEQALQTGWTQADDNRTTEDDTDETEVVRWLMEERMEKIIEESERLRSASSNLEWKRLQLRPVAKLLLTVRGRLPKGDRIKR